MSEDLKILIKIILTPLSKIYGGVVFARNRLFDLGILKQEKFEVPVIVVGNISVGGTGKTPHVEYILSLLYNKYRIGVVSRGYKRKTSGFVFGSNTSTPKDIGDEPYQILKKFNGRINLAVCEDRRKGIKELLRICPDINLIVLDDAFQHRYVKPSVSIVLMEYSKPVYNDNLLPLGRLRESIAGLNRAEMVVVTKCPEEMKPMDFRLVKNNLNLFPSQGLFFSQYKYSHLVSVFPESSRYIPNLESLTQNDSILMITGIASPKPFVKYIKGFNARTKIIHFADHHDFEKKDLELIESKYEDMPGINKLIITTEKDAVRLSNNPYFPQRIKAYVFYVPIEVDFIKWDDNNFNEELDKELSKTIL